MASILRVGTIAERYYVIGPGELYTLLGVRYRNDVSYGTLIANVNGVNGLRYHAGVATHAAAADIVGILAYMNSTLSVSPLLVQAESRLSETEHWLGADCPISASRVFYDLDYTLKTLGSTLHGKSLQGSYNVNVVNDMASAIDNLLSLSSISGFDPTDSITKGHLFEEILPRDIRFLSGPQLFDIYPSCVLTHDHQYTHVNPHWMTDVVADISEIPLTDFEVHAVFPDMSNTHHILSQKLVDRYMSYVGCPHFTNFSPVLTKCYEKITHQLDRVTGIPKSTYITIRKDYSDIIQITVEVEGHPTPLYHIGVDAFNMALFGYGLAEHPFQTIRDAHYWS